MGQLYQKALTDLRLVPSPGEKYPEIAVERIWEDIIKKLLKKEYKFDAGFFGSLNEFSRKVAYFFHASLQGTGCYPGAVDALRLVKDKGIAQGLISDAQIFSVLQLERGLARQDPEAKLDDLVHPELRCLSFEERARKPSERLYRHAA